MKVFKNHLGSAFACVLTNEFKQLIIRQLNICKDTNIGKKAFSKLFFVILEVKIYKMSTIPKLDFNKIKEKIQSVELNEYEKRFLKFTQLMRRENMLRNAIITHKK